jgi:hypothetical protein
MSAEITRPPEPAGAPKLLLVMSGATAAATALIWATLAVNEWWLLPVTVLAVIAGAAVVLIAIARALGDGAEADAEAVEAPVLPAAHSEPAPSRDDHAARRRPRYAPDARRSLRT